MSLEIEKIDLSGVVASGGELSSRDGERSIDVCSMVSSTAGTGLGHLLSRHGCWTPGIRDDPTLESDESGRLFRRSGVGQALEESAKVLMRKQKYDLSVNLLEGVVPMTSRQQLLLAECYLYTGHCSGAKNAIGHAARLMTSSLHLRKYDVTRSIKTAIANSAYVRALILLQCAPRYAFLKFVPDEAVIYIDKWVSEYSHVVKAMADFGDPMHEIAKWFVKEMMLDILLLFREITGSSYRRKVASEVRILTYFGLTYRAIGENAKALECFQQGLGMLIMNYDDRVEKTKLFGILLHNAALAYETIGDFAEAEDHYLKAIEAFESAEDWDGYRRKFDSLTTTRSNLKLLRKNIEALGRDADPSIIVEAATPPGDVYVPSNLADETK